MIILAKSIPITIYAGYDDPIQFFIFPDITIKEFDEMIAKEIPKYSSGLTYYLNDSESDLQIETLDNQLLPYLVYENFKMKSGSSRLSYDVK